MSLPENPAINPLGKFVSPDSVCGGSVHVVVGRTSPNSSGLTSSTIVVSDAAISFINKNTPLTARYTRL